MSQDNANYNMDSSRGKVDIHKVIGTLFNTSSYQQYSQQYPQQETYNSGFVPINDPMMNQYSNSTSYDNRFTAVPPSFQEHNPLPPSFQTQNNSTLYQQQSTLPPSFMNHLDNHTSSAIPPYGNFTNTTIPPYAQMNGGNITQSNGWCPVPNYPSNNWNGQNSEYVYLNSLNPVEQQSQVGSHTVETQSVNGPSSSSSFGSDSSPSHVVSTSSTPVDNLMSSMSLNPSAPPVDASHIANEVPASQPTNISTSVASTSATTAPLSVSTATAPSVAPISQVASSSAPLIGSQSTSSSGSVGSVTQAPVTQANVSTPSVEQAKNNIPSVASIPAPISSDIAPPVLPPNEMVLPLPDQVDVPVPPFAEVNASIPPPPPMVQPVTQAPVKPDSSRVAKMHIHTINAQGGNMLDQIRNGKSGLKHEDRMPASRKSDDDLASTLAGALDARFGKIRKQQEEEEEETADEEWLDRSISRRNITAM